MGSAEGVESETANTCALSFFSLDTRNCVGSVRIDIEKDPAGIVSAGIRRKIVNAVGADRGAARPVTQSDRCQVSAAVAIALRPERSYPPRGRSLCK